MSLKTWEAFALRYASVAKRRQENFIAYDPHDGPMPMDYFVWFLRCGNETILVDTGFSVATAQRRGRTHLRCPIESLKAAGVALDDIRDTIITHAHYDHAGNTRLLPRTRFHVQESEMRYATGRDMRHAFCRHAYDVDDVCDLLHALFQDRVVYHDGSHDLRSGISLHWVGGHTGGMQIVRVHTRRGWVVLASDATHYLANLRQRSPFPIVADVAQMLRGYELIESLAESPDHIIAGHDPLTFSDYRSAGPPGLDIVDLCEPV